MKCALVFEQYSTSRHGPGADRPRPLSLLLAHWRLTLGTFCCDAFSGLPLPKYTSGMGGRSEVGNCRRIAASPVGTQYRRERPCGIEHTWLPNGSLLWRFRYCKGDGGQCGRLKPEFIPRMGTAWLYLRNSGAARRGQSGALSASFD